ncbi:MAG: outer membrane beta-barrel protein [Brevinematia bacterium]
MKKAFLLIILFSFISLSSQAFELENVEKIGNINIDVALTAYVIYDRGITYYDASSLVSISKNAEPIGFSLVGGAYYLPVVGIGILKTTTYTDLFSTLPIAYVELVPIRGLSLQFGKLSTLIGYESAFTYLNNHIQRGLVWNMQPLIHSGVRLVYTTDLLFVKIGINDGFYSLVTTLKPAIEATLGLTLIDNLSISFNIHIPDGSSIINTKEFNSVISYIVGDLSFGADLVYVESPKDSTSATAIGGAAHLSYFFKPFKISGRIEYVQDNPDIEGVDLIGLGDKNKGLTLTLTPSYIQGPLLFRLEISYVNAENSFIDDNKDQTRFGLEVGLLF